MSTIAGGAGAPSSYDSLSALVDFIKSPDSQVRVKELRDLEASSKAASDKAAQDVAEAKKLSDELDAEMAKHDAEAAKLKADQDAHAKRVANINAAIAALQSAISGD